MRGLALVLATAVLGCPARPALGADSAALAHVFPDGSPFEGVGIAPGVPVEMAPEDLKTGRDPVLARAIELAANRSRP